MVVQMQPLFSLRLFRRSFFIANLHGQRRNAPLDETILIATNKQVPQRLGIIEDSNPFLPAYFLCSVPQCGFIQTVYDHRLQRNDGKEHVSINVGHHGLDWHGWVAREILRSTATPEALSIAPL